MTNTGNITDIYKYLMKKHDIKLDWIKISLDLFKKCLLDY